MEQNVNSKIGIMDWGIGGMSAYKVLRQKNLSADVLYYSDSGYTTYGKLSPDQMRGRLREIAIFFQKRNVYNVLVACNTASTALATDVELFEQVKFQSIIPGGITAVHQSNSRKIGVIGSSLTISSQVYQSRLRGTGRQISFVSAQPLSAFVESGELNSPKLSAEITKILEQLHDCDTLLLACTHYPALIPAFASLNPNLKFLDPALFLPLPTSAGSGQFTFYTTGSYERSKMAALKGFGVTFHSQDYEGLIGAA